MIRYANPVIPGERKGGRDSLRQPSDRYAMLAIMYFDIIIADPQNS